MNADAPVIVEADRVLTGFDAQGAPQTLIDAGVLVDAGVVAGVGPVSELAELAPHARRVPGRGRVVVPGFVNAHHHVGLTPFQLGSPDHSLEVWFASRLGLPDVDPGLDTLYSAMQLIRSGVTTVQHLHSRSPGDADRVHDTALRIIGAYREIGLRVSYSLALRDQNRIVYGDDDEFLCSVPPGLAAGLRTWLERFPLSLDDQADVFRQLFRSQRTATTEVQLAPSNLHWLSDDALDRARSLHEETGAPLHMHVVETPYQREYARRRFGESAVTALHRRGLLHGASTLGHAVWVDDADIDLLAATGAHVCHNCSSNIRLASGRAPIARMVRHGIPVALGIDEAGVNDDRDMLQEMRLAFVTGRSPGIGSERLRADDVLRMATEGGASTTAWGKHIGRVEVGRRADLVVLDWEEITRPYQSPLVEWTEVLVQRAKPHAVRDVMVDGRWVLRDGEFTLIDERAVLACIAASLAAAEPRGAAGAALAAAAVPPVARFYDGYLPAGGLAAGHDDGRPA